MANAGSLTERPAPVPQNVSRPGPPTPKSGSHQLRGRDIAAQPAAELPDIAPDLASRAPAAEVVANRTPRVAGDDTGAAGRLLPQIQSA